MLMTRTLSIYYTTAVLSKISFAGGAKSEQKSFRGAGVKQVGITTIKLDSHLMRHDAVRRVTVRQKRMRCVHI